MNPRNYNARSLVFIIIGAIFMVVIDRAFTPVSRPHPPRPGPVHVAVREVPPAPVPVEAPKPEPQETPVAQASPPAPLPLWRKNAVPTAVAATAPRIALIIDDVGVDRKHSRAVMDLPGPLTMSFLPYARYLPEQAAYARSKGHELMVHVPMQAENGTLDAGPEVLKTGDTAEQIAKILDDDLAAFDGYVGINNHMGSKMTQDPAGMAAVMAELKKRGLLFVDSRTIASTVGTEEAKKAGVPYAERNVFLDDEETSRAIEGALQKAEHLALRQGLAVVIGHPRAETIAALKAWIPTLEAKGIRLVPVSAVVKEFPSSLRERD